MVQFPPFIDRLPEVHLIDGVRVRVLVGEQSVAFIEVLEDVSVSPHKHGAQWGIVLAGQVVLQREGIECIYTDNDTYFIDAGVTHGARLARGSKLIEFFEEPDRFKVQPGDEGTKNS